MFAYFSQFTLITGSCGVALGALCILVWLRIRSQNQLTSAEFQRIAVENAQDGLVVQDLNGIVLWVNQAYCEIMRRPASEMLGLNPLRYAIPEELRPSEDEIANFRYHDDDPVLRRFNRHGMHLAKNIRGNGELFWMQMTVAKTKVRGGLECVVLVCRDVTDQVEQEIALKDTSEALEQMSLQDALTGISNRRGLSEFYSKQAMVSKQKPLTIGILHIDLDRFKEVNDLHGHAAGDALLQHISDGISKTLRASDLIARAGGDEFVAICPGLCDSQQLHSIASAVASSLSTPMHWNGMIIQVTASIGAVLVDPAKSTLDDALNQADYALYAVKSHGRDAIQVFDKSFETALERQSRRTQELAQAIASNQIAHHFQPVFEPETMEIRSFEAMARWKHPTQGLIAAEEFLDVAESTGRIAGIDFLAATSAAAFLAELRSAGHQKLRVSINVSLAFLQTKDVVLCLADILKRHQIPPSLFVIELPESAVSGPQNQQTYLQTLRDLSDLGLQVIINDFQAGSLRLNQLPDLPISGLKISRSITSDLAKSEVQRKILNTMIEIATDLDLHSIIPGIACVECAKLATSFPCDGVQGNWFAKPMPAEKALGWIEQYSRDLGSLTDIAPGKDHRYLGATSDP